jgi:hypothetical protein
MPMSNTELFLRVALVFDTLKQHADALPAALPAALLQSGDALWHKTLHTVEHLIEHRDDFTAHNQVVRSMVEVEAWHGAIVSALTKALTQNPGDALPSDWSALCGQSVQGPMDEFTVPMRVWRMISALRTRPALWKRLEAARPRLVDDLQRGFTLMLKAIKLLDKFYQIRNPAPAEAQYMSELVYRRDQLEAWFSQFTTQADETFVTHPEVLGLLGLIPESLAVPFGGTAFDVLRHRKAQTYVADPNPSPPCPGWGTGTSQNNQNYWQKRP